MEKLGRYTLIRKIGAGGMADVWKARSEGAAGFEKLAAVKRVLPNLSVDDEFVEMFVREAKLVAGLVHPNIVQVHEFGQENGTYFIVMEYVAGTSGSALVKRLRDKEKRLSADIAVYIVAEAARALGYAHAETDATGRPLGIVHRDISPHNILLSYRGAVKVADFGIAKVASSGTGTAMGVFKGKLRYASPEQAKMQPLDGRSDLFSLGLVLFELLTGEPFFGVGRAEDIVRQIVTVEPDRDARVQAIEEKPLRAVLSRSLQQDRDKRFASATEMEQALLGLLGVEGTITARQTLGRLLPILFKDEHTADIADTPSGATGSRPASPSRPAAEPPPAVEPAAASAGGMEQVLADATVAQKSPIALGPMAKGPGRKDMPVVEGAGTMTFPGRPASGGAAAAGARRRPWLLPAIAVGSVLVGLTISLSGVFRGAGTPTPAPATPTPAASVAAASAPPATPTPTPTAVAAVENPAPRSLIAQANAAYAERDLTTASELFTEAIGRDARNPDAWFGRGKVRHDIGDSQGMKQDLERFLAIAPKHPRVADARRMIARYFPTGTVSTPVVERATPTPAPVRAANGFLTVRADPWAEVWVDGKRIAEETPISRVPIPVGSRVVRLRNNPAGFDKSVSVEFAEGATIVLDANVSAGTIRRQ